MTVPAKATRKNRGAAISDAALRPDTFQPYVQQLAGLLNATAGDAVGARQSELDAALDGQPGRELRKLYTAADLRDTGTYFTGSNLANRLVMSLAKKLPSATQVVDPACGAGDLLVACARYFPLKADLTETLREWGGRLAGFDVNSAFVEATRYRLALLAIERTRTAGAQICGELLLDEIFGQIKPMSGTARWPLLGAPSVIVVNPPFSYGVTAKDCGWANGRVSQAASFMDICLTNATKGTRILAILPDVLRTGTRYEKWRKMIAERALVRSVDIAGQFDDLTEINVFLLGLEVGSGKKDRQADWARPTYVGGQTVKDLFHIHVGPVVPFRLDGKGPWFPYAHSQELPPWETVRYVEQRIRFKGTTYKPPFVVIRRTSKADYHMRCIGTLVTDKRWIAVENHLLVVLPRDKKVGTCKKLLEVLKRDSTSNWMNERIRCRHLTVGSVGDLPWTDD